MDKERGERAFELNEQVKKNENQRRLLLAENARLLSEIYDGEYYKELLGDEQGEWAGYLGDLEVFYTRSLVNSYVKVYKVLVGKYQIEPEKWVRLPITRLANIIKIVGLSQEELEEWFSKAETLTSKDWTIEFGKAVGKLTEEDEHEHDDVEYKICKKCGRKVKYATNIEITTE